MKQIIDRINWLIEMSGKTPNAFANQASIAPTNLRKMLLGQQTITDRTLSLISSAYQINYDWLKYGEGEPTAQEGRTADQNVVPFFDEEIFTGGYLQGTGGPLMSYNKIDDVQLPFLKVREGDFAVQVHGRSMIDTEHPENSINDGAIVCLRPWTEKYIEFGERYAIATNTGYTIKYLGASDKEGHLLCIPANKGENFAPYYINVHDVIGIAKVTAIINYQLL